MKNTNKKAKNFTDLYIATPSKTLYRKRFSDVTDARDVLDLIWQTSGILEFSPLKIEATLMSLDFEELHNRPSIGELRKTTRDILWNMAWAALFLDWMVISELEFTILPNKHWVILSKKWKRKISIDFFSPNNEEEDDFDDIEDEDWEDFKYYEDDEDCDYNEKRYKNLIIEDISFDSLED